MKSVKKYVFYEHNDEEDEEEKEEEVIKVIDNNIYFYTEVSEKSIMELTLKLKEVTKKNLILGITYDITPPDINLYINSQGGCVYSALSIIDLIINNKVTINTIITGVCMSAATLISIMGHNRYIMPNSYMLIHNISSGFWGKMHEFEDEMQNLKELTNKIIKIYQSYSKITKKQLDNLLKKDLLINSEQALKFEFIDKIKSN